MTQSIEAGQLEGYKEKFLREVILGFERNGFALPKEQRLLLKDLRDALNTKTNLFYKYIAEHKDQLTVTEQQIQGLPEDYKNARKIPEGYRITLDYPSYIPFMQYATDEAARKELYLKYLSRAADKNLDILKEILHLRNQIVELLGYPTFATYQQEEMMAKKPQNVWAFLNELKDKIRPIAQQEYAELLAIKKQQNNDENATVVNSWESSFYKNILLKQQYDLDNEQVKEYFSLPNVLNGLFQISGELFGITFTENTDVKKWHPEVQYFEVRNTLDRSMVGHLYLDLFPRANKYNHAACFPLVQGRQTETDYQLPVLALVCNFPQPTTDKPSLLRHADVETMFHEFGHALHVLLTESPLAYFAGTNTARDFVEVPSQLMENWAWDYQTLKLFAKHYQTGEVLPEQLFEKMDAAKNWGAGMLYQQQIFYGMYDLTLHDGYQPDGEQTTTDILRKLQNELTLFPYIENTYFQAAFGHLIGYAASYYGYLWSLVYADDIFSVFQDKGIMNPQIGQQYRKLILAKGGSVDEMHQLITFLGRNPSSDAFFKAMGLALNQSAK